MMLQSINEQCVQSRNCRFSRVGGDMPRSGLRAQNTTADANAGRVRSRGRAPVPYGQPVRSRTGADCVLRDGRWDVSWILRNRRSAVQHLRAKYLPACGAVRDAV